MLDGRRQAGAGGAAGLAPAMLLIQIAASQARIGPFAERALETPHAAANSYRRGAATVSRGLRPGFSV